MQLTDLNRYLLLRSRVCALVDVWLANSQGVAVDDTSERENDRSACEQVREGSGTIPPSSLDRASLRLRVRELADDVLTVPHASLPALSPDNNSLLLCYLDEVELLDIPSRCQRDLLSLAVIAALSLNAGDLGSWRNCRSG